MENTCNFCNNNDQGAVGLQQNCGTYNSSILDVVLKHFWFTYDELKLFNICDSCRNKLLEFHHFYCQVEKLYPIMPLVDEIKFEYDSLDADMNPIATKAVKIKSEKESIAEEIVTKSVGNDQEAHEGSEDEDYDDRPPYWSITDDDIRIFCQIKCHVCAEEFDNVFLLRDHCNQAHDQGSYVNCCNIRFYKRSRLKEHILLHIDPACFRCKRCNKIMGSNRSLKLHMKRTHLTEDVKIFKCNICPKRYTKRHEFKNHMKCKHNKSNLIEADKDTEDEEYDDRPPHWSITDDDIRIFCQIKCHVCSEDFDDFTLLRDHCNQAHNQKSYVNCCNTRFDEKNRLKEHILLHIDPASFRCKHCMKIMGSRRSLKRHMDSAHLSEEVKRFKCKKCPTKYAKRYLLNRHIKSNH